MAASNFLLVARFSPLLITRKRRSQIRISVLFLSPTAADSANGDYIKLRDFFSLARWIYSGKTYWITFQLRRSSERRKKTNDVIESLLRNVKIRFLFWQACVDYGSEVDECFNWRAVREFWLLCGSELFEIKLMIFWIFKMII